MHRLPTTARSTSLKLEAMLGSRTRLVAVTHVSNVLGTVLLIAAIARLVHAVGARLLVDGCQAVLHINCACCRGCVPFQYGSAAQRWCGILCALHDAVIAKASSE